MSALTHFDAQGQAHMVDVAAKPASHRIAVATGRIEMLPATLALIEAGNAKKGDVLGIARIAGIQAAKKTSDLIPLCHPLPISAAKVDLAFEADARRLRAFEARHGGEQRLGIRMMRAAEDALGGAELHDAAEIEHGDLVGEIPHDAQVMRDEDIAHLPLGLEVGEEIEDRRLHRDVERRGRLVADDEARLAGKSAGDGDTLLEPPRQLARLGGEMAFRQADRTDELEKSGLQGVATQTAETAQRAADDAAHAVGAVQGGIGILEDDLQRLDLIFGTRIEKRRQRPGIERNHAALVGRQQTQEQPGESRLAAARFTDEP